MKQTIQIFKQRTDKQNINMGIFNKEDNSLNLYFYYIQNNLIYGKLKRTLYLDMEIKYSKDIDFIRNIFERLISL